MSTPDFHQFLHHTLEKDFESPNPEVRKGAIFALGRLGSGAWVLDLLRRVAASDPDPEVRFSAKKALNYWEGVLQSAGEAPRPPEIRTPEGELDLEALRQALQSVRASDQISAVIESVRIGDPRALEPLRELTETEGDPWVLSMGVKALGSLGDEAEIPRVRAFLEHENHRVIANAIEALELLADPELAARVEPFLESEDNRVRANAVMALGPLEPELAFSTLSRMARDHRPWMRASAIFCLKLWNEARAVDLLLEICENEHSEDLLGQTLDALVANAETRLVGPLTAWSEGSAETRAKMLIQARNLIATKSGVDPSDFPLHKEDYIRQRGTLGAESGMFRLDPRDLEDLSEDSLAKPARGYSSPRAEPSAPPGDDAWTWKILALALGLGLTVALALLASRS